MIRASNVCVGLLNICILLNSFTAIGFAIKIKTSTSLCDKVLQEPLFYIGVGMLIMSLLGIVGSCCQVSLFLWLYLFVLFIGMCILLSFTVFTFMVTNKEAASAMSAFGDYSNWLQKFVDGENWDKIKSCLGDAQFCQESATKDFFGKESIGPTRNNCCRPPTICGMQSQNATFWVAPKTDIPVPDSDCTTWSNVQTLLCFDCKTCKVAILDNIRDQWRKLALINIGILFFVSIVYSVGCCALSNNQRSGYERYRGY